MKLILVLALLVCVAECWPAEWPKDEVLLVKIRDHDCYKTCTTENPTWAPVMAGDVQMCGVHTRRMYYLGQTRPNEDCQYVQAGDPAAPSWEVKSNPGFFGCGCLPGSKNQDGVVVADYKWSTDAVGGGVCPTGYEAISRSCATVVDGVIHIGVRFKPSVFNQPEECVWYFPGTPQGPPIGVLPVPHVAKSYMRLCAPSPRPSRKMI